MIKSNSQFQKVFHDDINLNVYKLYRHCYNKNGFSPHSLHFIVLLLLNHPSPL